MDLKLLQQKVQSLDLHLHILCRSIAERRYGRLYVHVLDYIRQYKTQDASKRAALVAHDLQLIHGVEISYFDLLLLRKLTLALCPECDTTIFPPDYLHKLDVCLRFFAKDADIQFVPKSLRFSQAPAIVFEVVCRNWRKRKKYDVYADLFLVNPTLQKVRHDSSIVISGVPRQQFGPLEIDFVYDTIKPFTCVPELNGHVKYYSVNPITGSRGRRYHFDRNCKSVRAAGCRSVMADNEFLLANNIVIPCKVCCK